LLLYLASLYFLFHHLALSVLAGPQGPLYEFLPRREELTALRVPTPTQTSIAEVSAPGPFNASRCAGGGPTVSFATYGGPRRARGAGYMVDGGASSSRHIANVLFERLKSRRRFRDAFISKGRFSPLLEALSRSRW